VLGRHAGQTLDADVDALSITPPGGATDSIRCAMPTWFPIAV
jgi:hypothetical protein